VDITPMEFTHIIANIGGGDWSILSIVDSKQNVENRKYESIPERFYQMFNRHITAVT
jgi:hypothetical protein